MLTSLLMHYNCFMLHCNAHKLEMPDFASSDLLTWGCFMHGLLCVIDHGMLFYIGYSMYKSHLRAMGLTPLC